MSALLILEGVDGAGKTTLAERLSKSIDAPVVHWTEDRGKDAAGLFDYRVGYFRDLPDAPIVICDRHYPSEMAYGPVVRRRCMIRHDDRRYIEERLRESGSMLLLLHGTGTNDQDEMICKLRRKYLDVYGQARVPKMLVARHTDFDALVGAAAIWAQRHLSAARRRA